MVIRSGIGPLDDRLGGLREGGLYLITGVPGSGRLVALLHFLDAGLGEGPVGLVTAAPPARVFEESLYWGFGLGEAWRDGSFRLLTLQDDFERRLTSAPDPAEVYEEMGELLGADVRRLALYPGSSLWDARAGTSFASRFLRWTESHGATILAAVGGSLNDGVSPATERLLESSTGILSIRVVTDGLREVAIQRMTPAPEDSTPITLDLAPGKGLSIPTDRPHRRRGDPAATASKDLVLLSLSEAVPPEIAAWARSSFAVQEVSDTLRAIELVQDAPERFAAILIHLDRGQVDVALRACRALRRIARSPIVLATEDAVRGTDRVRAIEAGASEFLSSPLSVVELASRTEQAVLSGAREITQPSVPGIKSPGLDHLLPARPFADEVNRRLDDGIRSMFTFLVVRPPPDGGLAASLGEALVGCVRHEEGDCVGRIAAGLGVILQGTSVKQAPAFLDRVLGTLPRDFPEFEWVARSSSVDAQEIRREITDPSGSPKLSRTGT